MTMAERYPDESRVEAQLASAKTADLKARAVNDEMARSNGTLIEEMQRNSGPAMNTINPRGVMLSKALIATSVAAVLLAACAAAPVKPDGAADARSKLTQLQSDPSLAGRAPLAVKEADTAVQVGRAAAGRSGAGGLSGLHGRPEGRDRKSTG